MNCLDEISLAICEMLQQILHLVLDAIQSIKNRLKLHADSEWLFNAHEYRFSLHFVRHERKYTAQCQK